MILPAAAMASADECVLNDSTDGHRALPPGESFTLLASAAPTAAPRAKGRPAPAKPDRAARRRAEQAAAEADKAEQELARAEQRLAEARDAVAELRKQAREARSRAKRLDVE